MKKTTNLFYEINKKYSITINPDDQSQHFEYKKGDTRINKIRTLIDDYLKFPGIHYYLWWDISMPYKNVKYNYRPRIHLHGIIQFSTLYGLNKFLLYSLPHLGASSLIDIDVLNDLDIWSKYCKKTMHIMPYQPIIRRMMDTTVNEVCVDQGPEGLVGE